MMTEDKNNKSIKIMTENAYEHKQIPVASLLESEERYRALFDRSLDFIYLYDFEGRFIDANNAALNRLGYTREEISSLNFASFLSEDQLPLAFKVLQEIQETGIQKELVEFKLRHKNGSDVYVETTGSTIMSNGTPVAIQSIARDITERKLMEEKLALRNILLSTQQEASIDGILVVDENARILSFNRRFVELWGLPTELVEDGVDEPVLQFVTSQMADPPSFLQRVQYLYEHRQETSRDELILTDGRFFDRYSAPMIGSDKRYFGRVWYFRDITGRKRAEYQRETSLEALHESEERIRAITDCAHDAILMMNTDGNLSYWNPAAERILGYTSAEAIGRNLHELIAPERFFPAHLAAFPEFQKTGRGNAIGKTLELAARRKDGQEIDVELSLSAVKIKETWHAVGILHDITERKKNEELIKSINEQQQIILDASPAMIFYKDKENRFIRVNEAMARANGKSKEEMKGKTCWDIFPREAAERKWQNDKEVMTDGKPVLNIIEEMKTTQGTMWVQTDKIPYRNSKGEIIGIIGFTLDITERKRIESYGEMSTEILMILSKPGTLHDSIQDVLTALKIRTGLDAVGIRMQDGDDFPYFAQSGFSNDFLLTENTLIERGADGGLCRDKDGNINLECTCGLVISGKTDPANQLFTKGGSAWTNNSFPLLDLPSDQDPRHNPRNQCIHQGYASIALVPIRNKDSIIGLIQFNDRRKNCFSPAVIEQLEGIAANIGEALMRKRMEDALQRSETKFRTLYDSTSDAVMLLDDKGFFDCNRATLKIFGCATREEFCTKHPADLSPPQQPCGTDSMVLANRMIATAMEKDSVQFEWMHKKNDTGRTFPADVLLTAMELDGKPVVQAVVRDITERKQATEKIHYLATHDSLTGLPNRLMFSQILNHAIQAAKRNQRQFAVLFIDLDRFKIINDTLGHDAGDQLLQEIAARLNQQLRAVDVVGRLGGDEFVILIDEVSDPNHVAIVARKILASVIQPITLMGQKCRITASIGICMYPKDAEDEQSLMKNADIAMYLAKEEGKNNYQFYSKDIQSKSLEYLSIETNLRLALERNEFALHYQAKVDFKTNAITGVEALLRWQNLYLGSVTPTQFIPVAEETGLIIPIGRWVLKTVCAQNVAWQQQGLPAICIAVNLSRRQLTDDNLIDDIRTALNDTGMAPNLLELEITEGMVMHNPDLIISILAKIKSLGVRLAIDDFGTGYSSLAQIQHFPIDTLKVDRSFIRNIPRDAEDMAITEAIIAMGKTLSLTVVAEGVGTKEQMNFLKEHSCDEMQGYYFSKPIVPEQFADLLRQHVPSLPSEKQDSPKVM